MAEVNIAKQKKLSIKFLRSLIDYNPITGIVTWLPRTDVPRLVNDRLKGKIAGAKALDGYVKIKIQQEQYYIHRVIWAYVTGKWPKNTIDHKDLNKSNNSFANLRESTSSQNSHNIPRKHLNKHGYRGVERGSQNSYRSRIRVEGKVIALGSFDTPEKAGEAYCMAAKKYRKDFARFD